MPNFWDDFWDDLGRAKAGAWPEVTQWYRDLDIQDENWIVRLEEQGIDPPYGVAHLGQPRSTGEYGGSNVCKIVPVSLFYVAQGGDTGDGTPAMLDSKVYDMEQFLLQQQKPETRTFTVIQVLPEDLAPDVTVFNQINQGMNQSQQPYMSGATAFLALVGESP